MRTCLLGLLLFLAGLAGPASAAWEYGDEALVFEHPNDLMDVSIARDGQGGVLVAAGTVEAGYDRIWVSRIDHTGTEIWGDGGVELPGDPNANGDSWPIDVAPDGAGGAYCIYRQDQNTSHAIMLAHLEPDGADDWHLAIYYLGVPGAGEIPEARLVPAGTGGIIAVWTSFDPIETICAARYTAAGTLDWYTEVFSNTNAETVAWDVHGDGSGGVLIAWTRRVAGVTETGTQRVNANGSRLWGLDGVLLWTTFGGDHAVCADGAGGAYVVACVNAQAWGQHLNAAGQKTWAAGGVLLHDTHSPYLAISTQPVACTDGAGGFIFVHGHETLYAQRVDGNGFATWGTAGVTVVSGMDNLGERARLETDDQGGVVVTYHEKWLIGSGVYCKEVYACRLDGQGATVWGDKLVDVCDFVWEGGVPVLREFPNEAQIAGDGSGGAMAVWHVAEPGHHDREVRAMGFAPDGEAPTPRLAFFEPESAAPGDTIPVFVFGDYLDTTLTYEIVKPGQVILPIFDDSLMSYQLISGRADLTGIRERDFGAYDLVVSAGATPQDTLRYALGIGPYLPCGDDEPFVTTANGVSLDGSPRKAAFDASGAAHAAWAEYDAGSSTYSLCLRKGTATGWDATRRPVSSTTAPLRYPALAVHPDGTEHALIVIDDPATPRIHYVKVDPTGQVVLQDHLITATLPLHPVVAVDLDGFPHVVYVEGDVLYYAMHNGTGWSQPIDLRAEGVPAAPDLALADEEIIVAFQRDAPDVGFEQMCIVTGTGGGWGPPAVIETARHIGSPAVAWDGLDRLLLAWTADWTIAGSEPRLHTSVRGGGVQGPVQGHAGDLDVHEVTVSSHGRRRFDLLTLESMGGPLMQVYARAGEGYVFYPRLQVNAHTDVGEPVLAAGWGGDSYLAYWLDYSDQSAPLHMCECFLGPTAVTGVAAPAIGFFLAAHPNPFNPDVTLAFALPAGGSARLAVYDVGGRLVRLLADGALAAGRHEIGWDSRDAAGRPAASGVYFARLRPPGGGEIMARLALVR